MSESIDKLIVEHNLTPLDSILLTQNGENIIYSGFTFDLSMLLTILSEPYH